LTAKLLVDQIACLQAQQAYPSKGGEVLSCRDNFMIPNLVRIVTTITPPSAPSPCKSHGEEQN
jgi:hypothetical protein